MTPMIRRIFVIGLTASGLAFADGSINQPGAHTPYSVEIEPHALLGWDVFSRGFGAGVHFNFPLMKNGFISTINNNVAFGIGPDLVISGRYRYYDSGTMFLLVPAKFQWNFFIDEHWSLFPELGAYFYHGFYDCGPGLDCGVTGFRPLLEIGGRYKFSDRTSLTFRIGYPSVTIGASFFQ